MSVTLILILLALLLAVFSLTPWGSPHPFLAVAVIVLCVVLLIGSRGG